jgi:hypothetical protein
LSFVVGAPAATRLHASIVDSEGIVGRAGAAAGAGARGALVTAGAVRGDAEGFEACIDAEGFGGAACCSGDVPVQLATTRPVTTAVTITSARPIAVNFHGSQLRPFIVRSFRVDSRAG